MQITKFNPEGIPVLTVQGQLDGTTSPQLEGELLGLIQARSNRLIIDLGQVPLVSSAALRVLLSSAKRMKKHGGHIHLCALRPEVEQVFAISDLTAFFGIHPDLAAAVLKAKTTPIEPPKVEPGHSVAAEPLKADLPEAISPSIAAVEPLTVPHPPVEPVPVEPVPVEPVPVEPVPVERAEAELSPGVPSPTPLPSPTAVTIRPASQAPLGSPSLPVPEDNAPPQSTTAKPDQAANLPPQRPSDAYETNDLSSKAAPTALTQPVPPQPEPSLSAAETSEPASDPYATIVFAPKSLPRATPEKPFTALPDPSPPVPALSTPTHESSSSPYATIDFSARLVPAEAPPKAPESEHPTPPERTTPIEQAPMSLPPALVAGSLPNVETKFAPAVPKEPAPIASIPTSVAPPVPVAPPAPVEAVRPPAPPTVIKTTAIAPLPAPVPPSAASLPQPAIPPQPAAASAPAQIATKALPPIAPSYPTSTPVKPLVPILVVSCAAFLILAGIGGYLVFRKADHAQKDDRTASVSPTATPRPADSHTPAPSPTATPVVVESNPTPSPSAIPTPTPIATVATPMIAQTTPVPTPMPLQTPALTPTSAATPSPEETPSEVIMSASGAIDTNRESPENQAVRQAVMQRIDAMPLSEADKERLYTALESARGLGKLVAINFATGRTDITQNDVTNLDRAVHGPKVQRFLDDPTVVLVVLGFSDTKGNEKANKEISERRAKRIVDALRGPCKVSNVIRTIGMGGQTIAGETLDKNRVVEVWAVLP